jgi:4-amino-4-deoxy-L-arabinose transferase-like glycosyltransferase
VVAGAVILVLMLAAAVEYSGLGGYDPFYDSGVYLESALIRRGYSEYGAVFSSQPPLWLPLLRFSFYLCGESFLAGQALMATACVVTIAAVIAAVAQLQGRLAALLAAALLTLAPVQLSSSHLVIAEEPSVAFAAVAMAAGVCYSSVGRRVWLVVAAIAVTCSILTKLFGLYTVPAILLLIIARWWRAPMLGARHHDIANVDCAVQHAPAAANDELAASERDDALKARDGSGCADPGMDHCWT